MSSTQVPVTNEGEDVFPCSVCVYSMFTDRLGEKLPCVWNEEKNSCEHCLERTTRKCRDVHESANSLVRKLLRLREVYLDLDPTDSQRATLAREMCGLVRDYRGLDSGASKRQKGSARKTGSSRRRASSPVAGLSKKRRRHSTPLADDVVHVSSDADVQEPLRLLTPLRAGMSQIQVEVGNVQVSIDQLATRLTSGTKELRGTAETGFCRGGASFVSTFFRMLRKY
ncbi:hypothetical protein CIHG_01884 [Coccidioides immitis H538.4]|uniref:Uncharacterized protein n=3 Tax=Coccidioides immitis TaxID=5501 RepID=A0A0J8R848_COCIT|nr:hypothetical protein CIRG_06207 [Coccidioides immitis RMSCC 2394]KMU80580.1 hypothetical protein CISG_08490 [Coccidioides immitis RMSCC 3703]KMU84098.1 hypothetical protein CIHG_01884 [Coccidioides immitis H538.4]